MDIQTMRYILALNQYRNFSEAAFYCNTTQSTISKHLQKVEDELGGLLLFDRSSRPFKITAAGREFINYAEQMVADYDQLLISMKKYRQTQRSELLIGSIPAMGRLGIYEIIHDFRKVLPSSSRVSIRDYPSHVLTEDLRKGLIDVAFLILAPAKQFGPDITYYRLSNHELYLIINRKDPLAQNTSIDLNSIQGRTFITLGANTYIHDVCRHAFEVNHMDWNNILTYCNNSSIIESIEAGQGVGMLTKEIFERYNAPDLKAIPLKQPLSYSLVLAYSNRLSQKPITKEFINFILERCAR